MTHHVQPVRYGHHALLVDAAPVAMVVVDLEGRIHLVNRQAERWLGYGRDELIGQPLEMLLPADVRAHHGGRHPLWFDACGPAPMAAGCETRLRRKDGSELPVEIALATVAAEPEPLLLASIVDVTERHAADQALRDHVRLASLRADLGAVLSSADPLEAILQDAASVLVEHLDVSFFRIWTVDEAQETLHLQASAGLYTHRNGAHARVPLGQFKIGRIALHRTPHLTNDVVNDREISDAEWARREGMVAFAGYPLIAGDRVVGVMATFARRPLNSVVLADLEAVAAAIAQCIVRKRAEAALQASEARLRMTMDNTQHGLWDWEIATGRVETDDQWRWYSILGYAPNEVPPTFRLWESGIHPDDYPRVTSALNTHLEGRSPLFDVDYRARTKNGDWLWMNTRGRVYARDAQGAPLRMMGTVHDISARKRTEAELQHTQKLESLGILAGGIAHDFNNLLTGVLGYSALAKSQLTPESPALPMLDGIEHAARRAADLTQQMLAYSGRGQFVIRTFHLDQLVREMHTLLATVVSKKADVQWQLEPALVEGDATQVRQVIMNLMTNASEALGDLPGTIRLRTGVRDASEHDLRSPFLPDPLPAGQYAFVEVTDDGHGMSEEALARIFDPFYTTKFTGRGLGLAAVLGIVRGHRGTIKVWSARDRGSRFEVLVPAAARPASAPAPEATPPAVPRLQGTVLVVEDEVLVREFAQFALEKAGFTVLAASDGQEALALAGGHPGRVDAVLLDLTMPGSDGPDVLHDLRSAGIDGPVLVMSGYSEREVAGRFAGLDANGFLQKPFTASDLVARLRDVLARDR